MLRVGPAVSSGKALFPSAALLKEPLLLRVTPGVSQCRPSTPPAFPRVFQCYLACHKKCLETLAIQCGHKKLQGKLQLFGQDFTKASQGSVDGIPFIIKKCISEIEKRALKTKVTHGPSPSLGWAGSAAPSRNALCLGMATSRLAFGSQKVPGDELGPDPPISDLGNSLLFPPFPLNQERERHLSWGGGCPDVTAERHSRPLEGLAASHSRSEGRLCSLQPHFFLFHRASTELTASRPAWRSFARRLRMGKSWWSCPRPPLTTSATS